MRDRRIEIRVTEVEYKLLTEGMPPDFETLSDFLRGAALFVARHPDVLSLQQNSSEEIEVLLELLRSDLIKEIKDNRSLIQTLISALQVREGDESSNLKEQMVEDLITWYLSNTEILKTFDDLYDQVTDPFLREVIPDAVQELRRRGLFTAKASGRLVWHG